MDVAAVGPAGGPIALAVGPSRVTAVEPRWTLRGRRPRRIFRRSLERGPADGGWPELTNALVGLADRQGLAGRCIHVALVPPLSEMKALRLPPAGRRQLRRLLRREASRHFVGASEREAVADAVPLGSGLRRRAGRCLAAHCTRDTAEAVLGAVRDAGLRTGSVTPAGYGLVEGLCALRPELLRGPTALLIRGGEWRCGVLLVDGRVEGVAAGASTERWEDSPLGRLAERTSGWDRERREEARVLTVDESGVSAAADGDPPSPLDPAALAAFGALVMPEDGPLLLPDAEFRQRALSWRRRTLGLAATAATLLILAGGLALWGLEREVEAVAAERAKLADQVARVTEVRGTARELRELADALDTDGSTPPRAAAVMAALTEALPPSAHLRSLRLADGELRLAGRARSVPALVPRLERSYLVHRVELTSTRAIDGAESDAFELRLTLRGGAPGEAGPSASAAGNGGSRPAAGEGDP